MALKSDGTVWAWGLNENGQLGDGTTLNRNAPVQVLGLTGVVAIAAGPSHSLALKPDGSVEKVKLASSTGNRELDNAIEVALSDLDRLPQAPPLEMPQPGSLQIVSRI